MTVGDRQLVRRAVASYFGGAEQTTTQGGFYYQGGALASLGLGTALPYPVKSVPEEAFTAGTPDGFGWGTVLTVRLGDSYIFRQAAAGKTSGWRIRRYPVICGLEFKSWTPHLEVATAGLDDLIDGFNGLIYADRTLGTTTNDVQQYPPSGRLIMQAGEMPDGLKATTLRITDITDRGKVTGEMAVLFAADTLVQA